MFSLFFNFLKGDSGGEFSIKKIGFLFSLPKSVSFSGPLTVNYHGANYLIGLVSFGYRCALPKFPGVYTAIAHYLKWIFASIQL